MNDPDDPMIGTLAAGRYRIQKLLGEGGMGQVYLAEHVAIEKRVALKILRAEFAVKGDIVTRFQQEAISASRIKHPNVLDVFDFGFARRLSKETEVVQTKRRLTRTGMIFGTPEYMAPEQASGKHADPRSDIYSVGIIMYEMFTGAVP